jgi:hypothetical protein
MWIHNKRLEESGQIIYEGEQKFESGLKSFESPYETTGTADYAVVKRKKYERKGKYSGRGRYDVLTVQFSQEAINDLNSSGIYIRPNRTIIKRDNLEYRATSVNDFGGNKRLHPVGIKEVKFERTIPDVAGN